LNDLDELEKQVEVMRSLQDAYTAYVHDRNQLLDESQKIANEAQEQAQKESGARQWAQDIAQANKKIQSTYNLDEVQKLLQSLRELKGEMRIVPTFRKPEIKELYYMLDKGPNEKEDAEEKLYELVILCEGKLHVENRWALHSIDEDSDSEEHTYGKIDGLGDGTCLVTGGKLDDIINSSRKAQFQIKAKRNLEALKQIKEEYGDFYKQEKQLIDDGINAAKKAQESNDYGTVYNNSNLSETCLEFAQKKLEDFLRNKGFETAERKVAMAKQSIERAHTKTQELSQDYNGIVNQADVDSMEKLFADSQEEGLQDEQVYSIEKDMKEILARMMSAVKKEEAKRAALERDKVNTIERIK
jgi:hypothetical protein